MSETLDRKYITKARLIILGLVAILAPAGCSADASEADNLMQTLPACVNSVGSPATFDDPKPKTFTFDTAANKFEGQPEIDAATYALVVKSLVQVVNFGSTTGAATGVLVEMPGNVTGVVTAGHGTMGSKEGQEPKPEQERINGNSIRFDSEPFVLTGWGCSTYRVGKGNGADISVMFPYAGLEGRNGLPLRLDAGCPDGQMVTLANLQNGRQPGDPAVYPGIMTKINDGSGRCVIITGLPGGEQIKPGASGGSVFLGGEVIALTGGAINPGGSTKGVETWTLAQVKQYTAKSLVGAPDSGYAVAWVVTGADLEAATAGAVSGVPEYIKAAAS